MAQRVLQREGLTLNGKQLETCRLKVFKWDGKSLEIHGLNEKTSKEFLRLVFSNEKKSGGGKHQIVKMCEDVALIQFDDKAGYFNSMYLTYNMFP